MGLYFFIKEMMTVFFSWTFREPFAFNANTGTAGLHWKYLPFPCWQLVSVGKTDA